LDALRGLAATLVILFHVNWNNHVTGSHFVRHAFLFVDLFFILSGFIISSVYFERIRTTGDAARFMTLRLFRLYPLHLTTLLLLVAIEGSKYVAARHGLMTEHDQFAYERTVPAIFANLFFLQGSGILTSLSWNTPSWSISCEIFAYLMFACFGILGWLRKGLIAWLAFPVTCGYLYIAITHGTLNVTFDIGTIRCVCGFCLGMIIAGLPRPRFPSVIALTSSAAAIFFIATQDGVFDFTVIAIFAALIYALQEDDCYVANWLHARAFAFLGQVSFSIYMVHYIVISIIGTFLKVLSHGKPIPSVGWEIPVFDISPSLGDGLIVLGVFASISAAFFTYRWIESPGRQMGYLLASRFSHARDV
jgi:peptidoglycan/LPS O-acetylase OafA/YrhL